MARIFLLGVLIVPLLSACQSAPKPAYLSEPTAIEKAEINKQIAIALKASNVLLAKSAFQQDSILVIERKKMRSLDQKHMGGRILGLPDRFQLVKQGRHCALVHLNSESVYKLPSVSCITAPH